MKVRRYDLSSVGQAVRLDNGWLKTDAVLTRVGVFPYRTPDGGTRHELRTPEEVFHKDALASFELVPVTLDHPPVGIVDSKNTKDFQRGSVSHVHQDGANVVANILLTDEDAITQATNGRKQVSCGYTCDMDPTPGVTSGIPGVANGVKYDSIQRNIRGNHVALVYRARAGESASIRLDEAGDQVVVHEDGGPGSGPTGGPHEKYQEAAQNASAATEKTGMKQGSKWHESSGPENKDLHQRASDAHKQASKLATTPGLKAFHLASAHQHDFHVRHDSEEEQEERKKVKTIKIDGIDFEVTEQAAQAFEKHLQELASTKAEVVKQTARADAAEEKLKEVEAKKPNVTALVNARLSVVRSAESLLKKDHGLKLDEMSDLDIKKAVVVSRFPSAKAKLDAGGEAYVNARFDALEEDPEEAPTALNSLRNPGNVRQDSNVATLDPDENRKKMIADGARYATSPKGQ